MSTADPPPKADRLKVPRRIAAGGFMLAWIAVAWISYQTPYLHACTEQIAQVGNSAQVRSCGPLSLLDPPLLVLLVAGGLLMVPDLSAIEIPGILRLEREVQDQRKSQEELVRTVQNLSLKLDVSASSQVQVIFQAAEQAAKSVVQSQKSIDELPDKLALLKESDASLGQEVSHDKTSSEHADPALQAPTRTKNDDPDVDTDPS